MATALWALGVEGRGPSGHLRVSCFHPAFPEHTRVLQAAAAHQHRKPQGLGSSGRTGREGTGGRAELPRDPRRGDVCTGRHWSYSLAPLQASGRREMLASFSPSFLFTTGKLSSWK